MAGTDDGISGYSGDCWKAVAYITRTTTIDDSAVIGATQTWLERAVIGLRLCPFAETPLRAGRIRFQVSNARSGEQLLEHLREELTVMLATPPALYETSLLVHPYVLNDFLDYTDFLELGDVLLEEMQLEGIFQIASFHPLYQFAGSGRDDIENYTNRSPYPTLHLLREASIDDALSSVKDPEEIYRRNIRTLRRLGFAGWARLFRD